MIRHNDILVDYNVIFIRDLYCFVYAYSQWCQFYKRMVIRTTIRTTGGGRPYDGAQQLLIILNAHGYKIRAALAVIVIPKPYNFTSWQFQFTTLFVACMVCMDDRVRSVNYGRPAVGTTAPGRPQTYVAVGVLRMTGCGQ